MMKDPLLLITVIAAVFPEAVLAPLKLYDTVYEPFPSDVELKVTVEPKPEQAEVAEVLKLLTLGLELTLNADELPLEILLLHPGRLFCIEVMVIIVKPVLNRLGVTNVP